MITNWKDLPIGLFMDLSKINRSQISDEEKIFKMTALLMGIDYDEFLNLPINEAREAVADASFLYEEPKPEKVKRVYHLGTRDYKLMRNTDGMTTAQYLNYQAIAGIPPEDGIDELCESVTPKNIATEMTPPAFIWHTAEDQIVDVSNSYRYATRLRELSIPTEMHIFPFGGHGHGLANTTQRANPHVAVWGELLIRWLRLFGFFA